MRVKRSLSQRLKDGGKRIKADRACYFMIAPFMLLFLIFTVLPVAAAIGLSFTDFNMLQTPNFVGLDNYRTLFLNDDVFIISVKNTLILAMVTGPLSYIACYIFAWFINELPGKLRAIMTVVFYAPSISGGVLSIWTYIFSGDRLGILNSFLVRFGFIDAPIQWLTDPDYMMACCIIVQLTSSYRTSLTCLTSILKLLRVVSWGLFSLISRTRRPTVSHSNTTILLPLWIAM